LTNGSLKIYIYSLKLHLLLPVQGKSLCTLLNKSWNFDNCCPTELATFSTQPWNCVGQHFGKIGSDIHVRFFWTDKSHVAL